MPKRWSLIKKVYNIKRTIKIMGIADLIARIKAWEPKYPPTKPGKGPEKGSESVQGAKIIPLNRLSCFDFQKAA
jgi:hypothetical protein